MIILKLGGSLLARPELLKQWLVLASQQGQGQLVIIPGGGIFAEQVRSLQTTLSYDDRTAHYMALLAMQQVALLFKGWVQELTVISKIAEIIPTLKQRRVVVWSPLATELDAYNIPASWDITSDSLAAWLAVQLRAKQLLLVKSTSLPEQYTFEQLVQQDILDPAFMRFIQNSDLPIQCIEKNDFLSLQYGLKCYE